MAQTADLSETEIEAERTARYRSLGIDPANPNPDGSDFHLMGLVDEDLRTAPPKR